MGEFGEVGHKEMRELDKELEELCIDIEEYTLDELHVRESDEMLAICLKRAEAVPDKRAAYIEWRALGQDAIERMFPDESTQVRERLVVQFGLDLLGIATMIRWGMFDEAGDEIDALLEQIKFDSNVPQIREGLESTRDGLARFYKLK